MRALFDEVTGGTLACARMPDVHDRVVLRERSYDLVAGGRRFGESLGAAFPDRRGDGERYLGAALRAGRRGRAYFAERALQRRLGEVMAPLLRAVGPSAGHLSLDLGLDATDAALRLDGTNLWIHPEADRERAFARFASDPSAPIPLVYASFPSAKDPSFGARYPGRATVELVTLASAGWLREHEQTRRQRRGETYDAWKREMSERLLEIFSRHRPGVRGHVVHAELSTPLSTRHFATHPDGEIYGLAHTPARFRLPLRAETDVPGLFLTGADLVTCGVAGALYGGALAAAAVATSEALRAPARTARSPWARRHDEGGRTATGRAALHGTGRAGSSSTSPTSTRSSSPASVSSTE